MSNITMEEFIDECLTGKKPKKKKRIIEDNPTNISSIFENEENKKSVINTKDAIDKTDDDDVENQTPEIEKTKQDEDVIKFILNLDGEKKIKRYTKEEFKDNIPLNFESIFKELGYDLDKISKLANNMPTEDDIPDQLGQEQTTQDEENTYHRFKLSVHESITSGSGNEKVELSWRRDGEGESAVETAEVITSNGSMPFIDSPDPLQSAIATFDRIYYNDIISKVREELDYEESSE